MTAPTYAYRGYFVDRLNHVRSIANIDARDDEAAFRQAEILLSSSEFGVIEVWDGPRMLGRRTASRWAKAILSAGSILLRQ
jgi:hypothetical protein